MIGAEMMITVQREKSFSRATKIPSRTAIPSAIFRRRWASQRPLLLGRGCAADSLTAATYHAGATIHDRTGAGSRSLADDRLVGVREEPVYGRPGAAHIGAERPQVA